MKNNLSISFCGLACENPCFLAASPVASEYDMIARAFDMGFAGMLFKTIADYVPEEVSPRLSAQLDADGRIYGLKNLENISSKSREDNLETIMALKKSHPHKILGVSIMAGTEEGWTLLAKEVSEAGADLVELNFSCPHTGTGRAGSDVGEDPDLVEIYTKAACRGTDRPVIAKMTPNIGRMAPVARAAKQGGAVGVAASNTVKVIPGIDLESMTCGPVIQGKSSVSGYSGRALRPLSLRFIHELASDRALMPCELSGIGGIETWRDALDYLLLGCRNIQVCTAVMEYGYRVITPMLSGLSRWLDENETSLEAVIGRAVENIVDPGALVRGVVCLPAIDRQRCIGCGRCYLSCRDGGHEAVTFDVQTRRPEIDAERCVGCHLCRMVCPAGALK